MKHLWDTVIGDNELSSDKSHRNWGYDTKQLLQKAVRFPGTLITTYFIR